MHVEFVEYRIAWHTRDTCRLMLRTHTHDTRTHDKLSLSLSLSLVIIHEMSSVEWQRHLAGAAELAAAKARLLLAVEAK